MSADNLISWLTHFYNNNIIKDYSMSVKEARAHFYRVRKDKSQEFGDLLATMYKYSIICIQKSKKSSILYFKIAELDKILGQSRGFKTKLAQAVKKKQSHKCKICLIDFQREEDLLNHKNNDNQHYFRNLYLNKSSSLKKHSGDIAIEIVRGAKLKQELVCLNPGFAKKTNIYVRNLSNNTYILDDIIELHQDTARIRINKTKLPLQLQPKREIILEMCSDILEDTVKLLAHVFLFVNQSRTGRLDLLKEITVHVSGGTSKDLVPTSNYTKPTPIQNDIDTRTYISVDVPLPRNKYVRELDSYPVPRMLERLLKNGLKPFHGINEYEKKYLSDIKDLVQGNANGQYLTTENYYNLLDLLVHMEDNQLSIDIRNYDTVTKDLAKVPGYRDRYQLSVPDLAERRPSLLPGDSVLVKGANTKTFQGLVRIINQESVILEFNRKFTKEVFVTGVKLFITFGYNRGNIRAEHRSIDLLRQHGVLAPFFPTKIMMPSIKNHSLKWFNSKIESNPEQQQAVLHILSRTSYPAPYLIFGPPGTGKTMTIVEAISQVWKIEPTANILVCAPSNSIANEIALRLTPYVPKSQLFRYMSKSYGMYDIPDEVLPFTNYDNGDFYQPNLNEICSYRIVISTLSNTSRLVSLGIPAKHFAYIFIDESGHATETETLLPIAGLVTSESNPGRMLAQIVLAGDPQQLGPVIHSPYAKQYGYGVSMLERLMATVDIYKKDSNGQYNPMVLTKLLLNYRSHPAILNLPNKLFYDNELISKADDLINTALNWDVLPNKKVPIIFHSVIGTDQREQNSPSYFNAQEIQVVIEYLNALIGNRLKGRKIREEDIGVITPYRKQVQKLRKACEKRNWSKLTIGSVEQFQGQERLIMIVSTVRSQPKLLKYDNKYHLGFLNNPKRFNVAITRAKALVVVIGNPNLLQHETYWKTFIKYCVENKCMVGTHFEFSKKSTHSNDFNVAKLRINGEPDDLVDFSRGNI